MDQMSLEELISNESDHEVNVGYYLRSKRRKLNEDNEVPCRSRKTCQPREMKRKSPIMQMPTEVIQNVLQFLPYHELSMGIKVGSAGSKIRLVNRRFKVIAENILSISFKNVEKELQALTKSTYELLQSTQEDMEIKCACKLLNMLEILIIQHSIIVATIWRYVYNDYYRTHVTTMYGGMIIDTFRTFIWKFIHYPDQLYNASIVREYSIPTEVMSITQMTKSFCVHFDKVTEETFHHSIYHSGCKILDLLECGLFGQKTIIYERSTSETFTAKYSYIFNNSWFIALPIKSSKEMNWRQKQRMMHMRLRRIVLAHSDMYLQQAQYERELLLRIDGNLRLRKPGNSVYTGYGDVEDTFFYYGVMNEGAYFQKFHQDDENDEEEDDDEEIQEAPLPMMANNQNVEVVVHASDDNILYRIPHLGVKIDVAVKCPLSLAPLKYIQEHSSLKLKDRQRVRGLPEINILFECYGAYYPRLPTEYKYDFKPTRNM